MFITIQTQFWYKKYSDFLLKSKLCYYHLMVNKIGNLIWLASIHLQPKIIINFILPVQFMKIHHRNTKKRSWKGLRMPLKNIQRQLRPGHLICRSRGGKIEASVGQQLTQTRLGRKRVTEPTKAWDNKKKLENFLNWPRTFYENASGEFIIWDTWQWERTKCLHQVMAVPMSKSQLVMK